MTRRRKKRTAKAAAQLTHALRAGQKRVAPDFGLLDIALIKEQIRAGAKRVYEQSNRVTHHLVTCRGLERVAVYDRKRGEVVTILMSEWTPQ